MENLVRTLDHFIEKTNEDIEKLSYAINSECDDFALNSYVYPHGRNEIGYHEEIIRYYYSEMDCLEKYLENLEKIKKLIISEKKCYLLKLLLHIG